MKTETVSAQGLGVFSVLARETAAVRDVTVPVQARWQTSQSG